MRHPCVGRRVVKISHHDLGRHGERAHCLIVRPEHGDSGDDLVRAAGERTQHASRVGDARRLAEHRPIENDDRVEAEHEWLCARGRECGRPALACGHGLLGGQRDRERGGICGQRRIELLGSVDLGRSEGQAEPGQQPSAPRRLRREHERGGRGVVARRGGLVATI